MCYEPLLCGTVETTVHVRLSLALERSKKITQVQIDKPKEMENYSELIGDVASSLDFLANSLEDCIDELGQLEELLLAPPNDREPPPKTLSEET